MPTPCISSTIGAAQQEAVAGQGRMVALGRSEPEAMLLLKEVDCPSLVIAAVNGPASVTLSGPNDAVDALIRTAKARRVPVLSLGIGYPFHSDLIDGEEEAIRRVLAGLAPGSTHTGFVSSVTGQSLAGRELDADYWWRNIRQPVRFQEAVVTAAQTGARIFRRNFASADPDLRYWREPTFG